MDNLIEGQSGANRPLFQFGDTAILTAAIPTGQLSLSGPAEKLDAAHWPVRGDLAHIRLAGRCFVPHYAVPMERTIVAAGANLLALNDAAAEVREALSGGTLFNVLDMTGGWAWGQVGEDGFVGYLPLTALEP
ncbi:MAG: SH3 domain-containing protein [Novosphingobium sp.]|nr:SH3 domain-containing protein [Novosphingobium sp.]